jgi:hypothetical protein
LQSSTSLAQLSDLTATSGEKVLDLDMLCAMAHKRDRANKTQTHKHIPLYSCTSSTPSSHAGRSHFQHRETGYARHGIPHRAPFIQVGGHGPPSVHVCMCRNCSQWFAVQWNYLDVYVSCAVRVSLKVKQVNVTSVSAE